MTLIMLARYWHFIVIGVLSLLVFFMSFMLRDASSEMQLMRVNHDLWKANYIARTNQDIIEIQRLNNERWQNAVNQNTQTQKQIASDYADNVAIVDSLSGTIDKNNAAFIKASADARTQYTVALSNVSKDCIGQISELSRIADGHVADIRMMQQAWPKN